MKCFKYSELNSYIMEESMENPNDETVMSVSKLLIKILRHEPKEYGIRLNARGWASMKEIREQLRFEVDGNVENILHSVLEQDEENRFQTISSSPFMMIRATRGHTADGVVLPHVLPDDEDLQWFRVSYENMQDEYVEAESTEVAKYVIERLGGLRRDWDTATFSTIDEDIHWEWDAHRTPCGDSLSGMEEPHRMIHQHGEKYLMVEKRANQAGDKGRYVTTQPDRVISRLPK